jgi:hypothetical protein
VKWRGYVPAFAIALLVASPTPAADIPVATRRLVVDEIAFF